MAAWTGVLAMTMVVRDEEDVLPVNLDYHLGQGVDVILVTDHGSSDGTPEIVRDYERTGRVYGDRDEALGHDQVRRVNRLTRIAEESHGADWVIHCDADEFWLPVDGSLRDVFAAVPDRYGYLIVDRSNFVPVGDGARPFHQRMVVRERRSLNLRGDPLEPKVAQRPRAGTGVTAGNHDLEDPTMDRAPAIGVLDVGHFPMREFEQFERKVINTGSGYERLEDLGEGVGIDQLELLRIQRAGELRDYYERQVLDNDDVRRGIEAGELVVDDRLQRFLAAGPTRTEERPLLQALLRRAWLEAGAVTDALLAADDRVRELEATVGAVRWDLERARADVAYLSEALAAIKASRIMRYTAPARRAYYRLRPGGGGRS